MVVQQVADQTRHRQIVPFFADHIYRDTNGNRPGLRLSSRVDSSHPPAGHHVLTLLHQLKAVEWKRFDADSKARKNVILKLKIADGEFFVSDF